jgi:hypothetical protein
MRSGFKCLPHCESGSAKYPRSDRLIVSPRPHQNRFQSNVVLIRRILQLCARQRVLMRYHGILWCVFHGMKLEPRALRLISFCEPIIKQAKLTSPRTRQSFPAIHRSGRANRPAPLAMRLSGHRLRREHDPILSAALLHRSQMSRALLPASLPLNSRRCVHP